jgi:hypothetical protein
MARPRHHKRKRLFPELPEGAPLDGGQRALAKAIRDGRRGKAVRQYVPIGTWRTVSLDVLPSGSTDEKPSPQSNTH